ncbi:hypothetical protein F4678DRAFT_480544 [Xylaria arbuscula]|nr:hypothetical protein F4678DRAFT_480544 [Xylaria arbuscula]
MSPVIGQHKISPSKGSLMWTAKKRKQGNKVEQGSAPVSPVPQALPETMPPLYYYIERERVTHNTAPGPVITPGPKVPLIAVDQLPARFDVLGVPRELSSDQAARMHNLGVVPRGEPFEVDITPASRHAYKLVSHPLDLIVEPFARQNARLVNGPTTVGGNGSEWMNQVAGRANGAGVSFEAYQTIYRAGFLDAADAGLKQRNSPEYPAERLLREPYSPAAERIRVLLPSPPRSSSFPTTTMTKQFTTSDDRNKNNITEGSKTEASLTPKANNGDRSRGYCRYWCWYGTCMFGDMCRYRHDMPSTIQEIQEVFNIDKYPHRWLKLMSEHRENSFRARLSHEQDGAEDCIGTSVVNSRDARSLSDQDQSNTSSIKDVRKRSNSATTSQQQQQKSHQHKSKGRGSFSSDKTADTSSSGTLTQTDHGYEDGDDGTSHRYILSRSNPPSDSESSQSGNEHTHSNSLREKHNGRESSFKTGTETDSSDRSPAEASAPTTPRKKGRGSFKFVTSPQEQKSNNNNNNHKSNSKNDNQKNSQKSQAQHVPKTTEAEEDLLQIQHQQEDNNRLPAHSRARSDVMEEWATPSADEENVANSSKKRHHDRGDNNAADSDDTKTRNKGEKEDLLKLIDFI